MARETNVSIARLSEWRERALAQNESAPGGAPKFQPRSEHQAATLVALTSRSLLELVIGIARGFIASGISRTRSTCMSQSGTTSTLLRRRAQLLAQLSKRSLYGYPGSTGSATPFGQIKLNRAAWCCPVANAVRVLLDCVRPDRDCGQLRNVGSTTASTISLFRRLPVARPNFFTG